MTYINGRYEGSLETVDQADTRREARYLLAEYRLAFFGWDLWLSQRPCKNWTNAKGHRKGH